MGVLDEAIRQHIELKRRHGASEQELRRKQEEALGPARRETAADARDGDEGLEGASPDPAAAAAPESVEAPFSEQETRIFSASPADDRDGIALVDESDESVPRDDAARPDSAADEPEDVLEETPEFLQETPEHDRLWFEQRPPRDFDFDDDK